MSLTGNPQQGVRLGFGNRAGAASGFSGGSQTGLIGIRERAELLGGSMEARHEGEEFTVAVLLPWGAEGDDPGR